MKMYSINLLLMLPVAGRISVVKGPPSLISKNITTSDLLFYGRRHRTVTGAAVFLSGSNLCSPRPLSLNGVIVFTTREGSPCELGDLYLALNSAGAVGLVLMGPWRVPGQLTFRHSTWNKNALRSCKLQMVDMYIGDMEVSAWQQATPGLIVRLGPPHLETYQSTLTSPGIVFLMRILVPLASFVSAAFAAAEVVQHLFHRGSSQSSYSAGRSELRTTALFVSTVMGVSVFLLGCLFASGMWTTFDLPVMFYFFFWTMLDASSCCATLTLVLFMREEARAMRESLPRRSIWVHFKNSLRVAFLLLLSSDVSSGLVVCFGGDESLGSQQFLVALIIILSAIIASIGCLFFAISYELSVPLLSYVRARRESGDSRYPLHIGRLAFTLCLNGFSLLFLATMHIFLVVNMALGVPSKRLFSMAVSVAETMI